MAAFDLQEQEQLDELKDWWRKYGTLVTAGVVILAVAVVGTTGWRWYQASRAAQASAVYGALVQASNAKDVAKVRQASGELLAGYDGTLQADLGALLASKAEIEANEPKAARTKLEWVVAHAAEPALRDLARLRLAGLLLDEKAYDDALKAIEAAPSDAFAARFADLRGDIHVAKGSVADARTAYKQALDLLAKEEQGMAQYKSFVELKLEALGEA
ncbi:YfgM family protein [Uliginosibacterium sp. H1]|uniref:YfgM family protein n=1 Tax=Uliginosibacterium sp. H1 TaxID=3114757 RepID=UPI002E177797|nr:tetratricopeptide repeat protein [Uliginosibacterium sp. H1]